MKRINLKKVRTQLLWLATLVVACSSAPDPLPEEIYQFKLHQKMIGEEASTYLDKMHLGQVSAPENAIGFYRGEKGSATLYVSYYANPELARSNWQKMTHKISPENSVFIEGTYLDIQGKRIYRCFGMGQTHYVFTHHQQLFWLSVETLIASEFLSEYLHYLQ